MKNKKMTVIVIILVIIAASALMKREMQKKEMANVKNTGIYILKDNYDFEKMKLGDISVASEFVVNTPLIDGKDIDLYRWEDHKWSLNDEALKRILEMENLDQKLFVFIVEDEPQYVGLLSLPESIKEFKNPIIFIDEFHLDGIEKSYPLDLNVDDLRDDKEVEMYLKENKKLEK